MTDRMKWAIKLALRLFSIFMIVVLFVGMLLLGPGGIGSFLDLRPFFCTALLPIPLVVLISGKQVIPFLQAALLIPFRERRPNPKVVNVCRIFRRSLIGCAALSFMATLVMMLQNLEDPCVLGTAMASSFLFLLWPTAINYLFISPIESQCCENIASKQARYPLALDGILLSLSVVVCMLTVFFVPLMTYSTPDANNLFDQLAANYFSSVSTQSVDDQSEESANSNDRDICFQQVGLCERQSMGNVLQVDITVQFDSADTAWLYRNDCNSRMVLMRNLAAVLRENALPLLTDEDQEIQAKKVSLILAARLDEVLLQSQLSGRIVNVMLANLRTIVAPGKVDGNAN